ncbi:triosephosphate isomerase [candidate division WWE3 bacterium]|uniref:Triosephosphate isomerase n=1 Tax=candidate division WWE3 bacterium TaxID=2053526 RepID=A0A955ECU5_UNCKA|nr:triosephosphate isomerase [candidate division WWE3 bacterium]
MNKLLVANWKQNMTLSGLRLWLTDFSTLLETKGYFKNVDILLAPSFPYFSEIVPITVANTNTYICAQNVSEFNGGSHTGDISATQLADYVKYCIVNHTETNTAPVSIKSRIENLVQAQITPIVCFVDAPSKIAAMPACLYAWEDPNNISSGGEFKHPDYSTVHEKIAEFSSMLECDILYGGSVNKSNATELANIPNVAGFLVGHASLDPEHFYALGSTLDS